VTFSISGTIDVAGGLAVYSGVDQAAPVGSTGVTTGAGTSATTASINVPFTQAMLVHLFTKKAEATPAPAGLTQRWSVLSPTAGVNQGATAVDEPFVGSGSTAARTSTGSTSAEWITQTVALRPAANTPSASLTWTASATAGVTGYTVERVVAGTVTRTWTVTPASATSTPDPTLANATAHTYRLWAYSGSWVSSTVTASLTTSC
jgi:hypothetical protein